MCSSQTTQQTATLPEVMLGHATAGLPALLVLVVATTCVTASVTDQRSASRAVRSKGLQRVTKDLSTTFTLVGQRRELCGQLRHAGP